MIYGYTNFQWSTGNPVTDVYYNEYIIPETTDNKSEYNHNKGIQDKLFLEEEVDTHEPLEDKDVINKWEKTSIMKRNPTSYQNSRMINQRKRMT